MRWRRERCIAAMLLVLSAVGVWCLGRLSLRLQQRPSCPCAQQLHEKPEPFAELHQPSNVQHLLHMDKNQFVKLGHLPSSPSELKRIAVNPPPRNWTCFLLSLLLMPPSFSFPSSRFFLLLLLLLLLLTFLHVAKKSDWPLASPQFGGLPNPSTSSKPWSWFSSLSQERLRPGYKRPQTQLTTL